MAPTEETILTQYLVAPSHLPAVMPLKQFIELFPRSMQSSPRIRSLYRDLQGQRSALLDAVASNIEAEAKRSKALRRAVVKARREVEREQGDLEVEVERALLGSSHAGVGTITAGGGSLVTVLPELENAVGDVEAEIQQLEEEEKQLMQEVRQTVSGLSDLRYGRFSNSKLNEQVLEGLDNLRETCQKTIE